MPLHVSLLLRHALLQCLHCKRFIREGGTLKNGQCPCGAVLVSVNVELNSLGLNQTETTPSLSDDIAHSNDNFRSASGFHQVDEESDQDDFSILFSQRPRSISNSSARSERKQEKLSDVNDDDEKTTANTGKTRQDSSSFKTCMEQSKTVVFYSEPDSGSEYQPSDSQDDMPLFKASKFTPRATRKNTRDGQAHQQKTAASKEAKAVVVTSSSSPSPSSATVLRPDRSLGLMQFNKEMRGELVEKNQDKSPKEITQMITDMWSKLTKEQKETYTYKSDFTYKMGYKRKKKSFLRSSGYALFISEHSFRGKDGLKNAARHWNKLDPETKETYNQRAKEIRDDWAFENPDEYQASMKAARAKCSKKRKASRPTY